MRQTEQSRMNKLTKDCIVIDTNVFVHLTIPTENICNHITDLLSWLARDKIKIFVDKEGRIRKEYSGKILPLLRLQARKVDDIPQARILLVYWLKQENQCEIEVDQSRSLMRSIKNILTQKKGMSNTDAFFVYLALMKGRILITNDRVDFIDEGTRKNERKKKLLKIKGRKRGAKILTSQEAYCSL